MPLIVEAMTSTIRRMTIPHPDPSEIAAGLVDLLDLGEIAPFGEFSTPASVAAYQGESSPQPGGHVFGGQVMGQAVTARSEEHTSELQSRFDLVCRLLLDKTIINA